MSDAKLVEISVYLSTGQVIIGECRENVAREILRQRFEDEEGFSKSDLLSDPVKFQEKALDYASTQLNIPLRVGGSWKVLRVPILVITAILTPGSLESEDG